MRGRKWPVFACAACFAAGLAIGSSVSSEAAAQVASTGAPASTEILVIRYHKIKKGRFPEFASVIAKAGPYFERAGARGAGVWQVTYPQLPGQTTRENPEYDEAYMLNRYASVEHWQATRMGQVERLAGTGPDFVAARESLAQRQEIVLDSRITVLKGVYPQGQPVFYPFLPK